MAIQPMALNVQSPQFNALGAAQEAAVGRQAFDANNITLAKQGLETVGSIALGAMGGKMDGEADPALFEQGLDMLEAQGIKVDQFRGRADVAPMVARASMTALQQLQTAQDERQYNLAMEKFQQEIAAASQPKPGFTTMTPEQTSQMGLTGVYQLGPDNKIVEVQGGAADTRPAPKVGFQWNDDDTQSVIPGGPEDQPASNRELSAGEKKELFEAQDAVAAGGYVLDALKAARELNAKAMDGAFAGERAVGGVNTPNVFGGNDDENNATLQYQNIVTELALNQLKTVFGGMPTEGERKILLDIQGSVDKPREVREAILARAEDMAKRRIQDAQAKAQGIQTGDYMQPGFSPSQGAPASDGAGWEVVGVED